MPQELNRILHQPIRTRIVALLAVRDTCDYNSIKKELNISDGHMTTHMRELIEHGYVLADKSFVDNKPRTFYKLTPTGHNMLNQYISALKSIILGNN